MLNLDRADRRRVTTASIITLVALPSLWLMSRDDPTAPAAVVTAGVVVGPEATDATADDTATAPAFPQLAQHAMGTVSGAFLERPETAPERSRVPTEPVSVATQAAPHGTVVAGRATYRSTVPGHSVCLVSGAPVNTRITVTNVNNGRSITCTASPLPATSRDDVVLHTMSFTEIADLTDAPVPVELTW